MASLKSQEVVLLEKVDLAVELEHKSSKLGKQIIAVFSLVLFTVLATFNPIVVRVAKNENEQYGKKTFIGSTTVFVMELLKALLCCVVIPIRRRSINKFFLMLVDSFTVNKLETLKISTPALMFVIQNNLYFFALQYIDVMLFSLTFQLRIFSTVVLMMIVLGRRFTVLQWASLFISLAGIIIVQIGDQFAHTEHTSKYPLNSNMTDKLLGLGAVLIMCMTTAFGSVYMEAVMKKSTADIFLQNVRLSLVSLPMSVIAMFYDRKRIVNDGFFCGWNLYVWLVIVLSAIGGIVVSIVIRHTDNVKKGFCQAIAIGGTAIVSIWLGDTTFTYYLLAGIVLVIASVILYALATRRQKDESEFQALVESAPEELAILEKEQNPAV